MADTTTAWSPDEQKRLCERIASTLSNPQFRAIFEVLAKAWQGGGWPKYSGPDLDRELDKLNVSADRTEIDQAVRRLRLRLSGKNAYPRVKVTISGTPFALVVEGTPEAQVVKHTSTGAKRIGLLLANASEWFTGLLIHGILEELGDNYDLIVHSSDDDLDKETELLARLSDCYGLLVVPVSNSLDESSLLRLETRPSVLVDRYLDGVNTIPSVHHDDRTAGRAAARFLRQNGCSKIWVVQQSGRPELDLPLTPVRDRVSGCRAERGRGMSVQALSSAGANEEGGELALAKVRSKIKGDHGVFATTDRLAIGCRHLLTSLPKTSCPSIKEKVISFEGQPFGDFIHPPLSRIYADAKLLGKVAARVLLQRIKSQADLKFTHYVLQPKLLRAEGPLRVPIDFATLSQKDGSDATDGWLDPREYYARQSAGTPNQILVVRELADVPLSD